MDYKNIEKKYRPVPFWSWNEKLDTSETAEQIHKMNDVGIGGYFMHARGGLQTEYMSEEWFDNVKTAINEGNKLGMKPWAYDENGWPSGFGSGVVNALGVVYQQKYLRMSDVEPDRNMICKNGRHWFYFDVNPYYVDVLDRNVIAKFIETAYEPYYEKFGSSFEGFFTDEPQISRKGIPWSFAFENEYSRRYGEGIIEHLEELFLPIGDYKNTRIKFWKMVTEMFSDSYCRQIYDWCEQRNLKLTGHLLCEESIALQILPNGACMPQYEYFHIPGMDWLCRDIRECITPMQVSSVAQQLGKKQVIAETFAMCGHNVSFAELKGIYEWQMVHGINLLCQHLEGYSIRGMRKRDYPPAMYFQQPWWGEYKRFNDAMSRVGKILSEGKVKAEILLIHPVTTAWSMYDADKNNGMEELDKKLLTTMRILENKHIMYHLGDEIIMERHAYVRNGKIVIGEQEYSFVIDSCCEILMPGTLKLIDEFKSQGGRIVTAEELPENNVIDNEEITYTERIFDDCNVHYFTNTSESRKKANVNIEGRQLDIYTGKILPFSGTHNFEPWGSLMIIEDGSKNISDDSQSENIVKLSGVFEITKPVENMITLDKCDYYFDGELIEKNGYVLNICERANALNREIQIHQDYHVNILDIPEKTELVCETPELFDITVNGTRIERVISGWTIDKSFKKIDISKYLKKGENIISFDCNFKQKNHVYDCMEKARYCETEKNKLVYDMEIEAVYLLGDFTVVTDGKWEMLQKNALRYNGDFAIAKPKKVIGLKHIEKQGYPFLCGQLEITGTIDISENDVLELEMKGISTITVEIGDAERTILTDNRINLSDFGVVGQNRIKLTVTNNLRNLLGPHHLSVGESVSVSPSSFYKESCIWNGYREQNWSDGYCFCEMSI